MSDVKRVVPIIAEAEAMQLSHDMSNAAEVVRWIEGHGFRAKVVEEKTESERLLFGDGDPYRVPKHLEYLDQGFWVYVFSSNWIVIEHTSIRNYTNFAFSNRWKVVQ